MLPVPVDVVDADAPGGGAAGGLGLRVREREAVAAVGVQVLRVGARGREGAAPAALGRELPVRAVGLGPLLQELHRRAGPGLRVRSHAIAVST